MFSCAPSVPAVMHSAIISCNTPSSLTASQPLFTESRRPLPRYTLSTDTNSAPTITPTPTQSPPSCRSMHLCALIKGTGSCTYHPILCLPHALCFRVDCHVHPRQHPPPALALVCEASRLSVGLGMGVGRFLSRPCRVLCLPVLPDIANREDVHTLLGMH